MLVQDDGVGLPAGSIGLPHDYTQLDRDRFGLLGMKERVALLNGTLRVESSSQTGTLIWVEIPFLIE